MMKSFVFTSNLLVAILVHIHNPALTHRYDSSASDSICWRSWQVSTISFPFWRNSRKRSRISFIPDSSNALNGSSNRIRSGDSTIAAAIPRRCFMPREYLRKGLLSDGFSPTRRNVSPICACETSRLISQRRERFFAPVNSSIKIGFSSKANASRE